MRPTRAARCESTFGVPRRPPPGVGPRRPLPDEAFDREPRAGYRAAFLDEGGANPVPVADPYALSRIPLGPDTDLRAVLSGQVARP